MKSKNRRGVSKLTKEIKTYRDIPHSEVEQYASEKELNITDNEQNFKEAAILLWNEKYNPKRNKMQEGGISSRTKEAKHKLRYGIASAKTAKDYAKGLSGSDEDKEMVQKEITESQESMNEAIDRLSFKHGGSTLSKSNIRSLTASQHIEFMDDIKEMMDKWNKADAQGNDEKLRQIAEEYKWYVKVNNLPENVSMDDLLSDLKEKFKRSTTMENGGTITKVKIQPSSGGAPRYATLERYEGNKVFTNQGVFRKDEVLREFIVPEAGFKKHGGKVIKDMRILKKGDKVKENPKFRFHNMDGVGKVTKLQGSSVVVKYPNENEEFEYQEGELIKVIEDGDKISYNRSLHSEKNKKKEEGGSTSDYESIDDMTNDQIMKEAENIIAFEIIGGDYSEEDVERPLTLEKAKEIVSEYYPSRKKEKGAEYKKGGQTSMKHPKSFYQDIPPYKGYKWRGFWDGFHHFVGKEPKGFVDIKTLDIDIDDESYKSMIDDGITRADDGGKMELGGILLSGLVGAGIGAGLGYGYRDSITKSKEKAIEKAKERTESTRKKVEEQKEKFRKGKDKVKKGLIGAIEKLEGGGELSNIYISIDDEEPISLLEFIEINTSEGKLQVNPSDLRSITNLKVGEEAVLGGGAHGTYKVTRVMKNGGKMEHGGETLKVIDESGEINENVEFKKGGPIKKDKIDKLNMDVPLFIRMLEYAREDAKTDMDLHTTTENAIKLSKSKDALSMKDYNSIVSTKNSMAVGGGVEGKGMYSAKSYQLTKDEFNYLLPVLRKKLLQSGDKYYFISDNIDDLTDMLNRLKGLYDNYDELKNMVAYKSSKEGSLKPFRDSMANGGEIGKNYEIELIENKPLPRRSWKGVVSEKTYNRLEDLKTQGGYLRYNIDLYDDESTEPIDKKELKGLKVFMEEIGVKYEEGGSVAGGGKIKQRFNPGDFVQVNSSENPDYEEFQGEKLTVKEVYTKETDDSSFESRWGSALYDLYDANGNDFAYSLYDYELKPYTNEKSMAGGGKTPNTNKKKLQNEIKDLQEALEGPLTDDSLKPNIQRRIKEKEAKIAEIEEMEAKKVAEREAEEKIQKGKDDEKKQRTQNLRNKNIYIDIDKSLKQKMRSTLNADKIPYKSKTSGSSFRVFVSNPYQADLVMSIYNEKREKAGLPPINKEDVSNVLKKRVGKSRFTPVKKRTLKRGAVTKSRVNLKSKLAD